MHKYFLFASVSLHCFVSLCLADDLSPLSDEFGDASSLVNWSRLFETEGWGADQMQSIDVNETRNGYLTMVPKTSTWDQDYRGILMFKQITGDFVATIEVEPRNRALNGAPSSAYSLAGIMVRTPRDEIAKPSDWTARGENYIFLSLGTGNDPGNYQFEVKSTINGASRVNVDAGAARATMQIVRLGNVFLVLRKLEGGDWEVYRRYSRSDMPDTVQVGITAYTDWEPVSLMDPFEHNRTSIDGNSPDLNAAVNYCRFRRPRVPSFLSDADFFESTEVSDSQIIQIFGDRSNRDPSAPAVYDLEITERTYTPGVGTEVEVGTVPGLFYRIEKSPDLRSWTTVADAEALSERLSFLVPEEGAGRLFLRVAEE